MKDINSASKSRLKVSEDVILTVAKLAALDVKGVSRLSGEMNLLSKLRNNAPIKIVFMGDVIAVDIRIIVCSSAKACAVAESVQTAVKENIQNMTGVAVARVNVIVDGVEFE